MSTKTTTAAIAAGALLVGGLAGANLASTDLASTDLPAPQSAAEALAYLDKGTAYFRENLPPAPTATPSPSDIPTTVGPTSTPTPVVTSSAPSPNITTPSPTPSGSIGALTWKPPALTSPTTITPTDEQGKITLAAGKDYVIRLPVDRACKNTRGLWGRGRSQRRRHRRPGRRRRRLLQRRLRPRRPSQRVREACGLLPVPDRHRAPRGRPLHLEQRRPVRGHQHQRGPGECADPERRHQHTARRVEQPANHADALQSWNGPTTLLVDGFTATTGYQGMFLNPHDTSTASVVTEGWQLRNVEIIGTAAAKYILWRVKPPQSIATVNVYTFGGLGNWNGSTDWPGVKHGVRAPAPIAATAGIGYVSPGYA